MENQELKHYIDEQLAGGISPDELKKLLTHHGWAPELVDAHLPKPFSPVPLPPSSVAPQINTGDERDLFNENRKKRKWGVLFIVLPFALLFLILIAYAVNSFVISSAISNNPSAPVGVQNIGGTDVQLAPPTTGLGERDKRAVAAQIINVALSLLGLIALLSIFVLIPIGIVFVVQSRRELKPGVPYDERSGKGDASVIPPELGHWNWGAAFLNIWWGIYYRVWISFVAFVPFVGLFWWIVMGVNGNKWAWQKNKWLSVEYFKKAQKKWVAWAIALVALGVIINVALMIMAWSILQSNKGSSPQAFDMGGSGLNIYTPPTKPVAKINVTGDDFLNATYEIDGKPVALKAGSNETDGTNTEVFFSNDSAGDLNGDGIPDTIFLLTQQTGGSGTFYYVTAALNTYTGSEGLNAILLGDRITPVGTELKDGQIIVKYLDRKPNEPMTAAPSVPVTENFKFTNGRLEIIK
jgi:hypothetical protein